MNYKNIFEKRIIYKKNKNGCWLIKSHKPDTEGYARIKINGKRFYIHRLSYQIYKGKINLKNVICHKCDNTLCINPDHLFEDSQKNNMIDKTKKKRNGNTGQKLKKSERKIISESKLSSYKLSKIYNVTPYAIRYLKRKI